MSEFRIKFCKVCNDEAIMRMQTTEYEDWFCKIHFAKAMDCVIANNILQMALDGEI